MSPNDLDDYRIDELRCDVTNRVNLRTVRNEVAVRIEQARIRIAQAQEQHI